jgi:integrase
MATGSIEALPSGSFRAVVRAGKDPITGKRIKLTETCKTEVLAQKARDRMLAQVEAESHPDRAATVETLMKAWAEAVDHGINTRATTEVYVRRVILPALGGMQLRKLQHRVDILDRLYTHLRRCSSLCDGKPFVEHKRAEAHRCDVVGCREHVCRPMAPSTVRRVHAILSGALSYAASWAGSSGTPPSSRTRRSSSAAGRGRRSPSRSRGC